MLGDFVGVAASVEGTGEVSDLDTRAHEALLAASHGYQQFYESELQDARDLGHEPDWEADRGEMLKGFAGWLVTPARAADFADWTPEQFRAEWERWNS